MTEIVILDAESLRTADLEPLERIGNVRSYPKSTPAEVVTRLRGAQVAITNKVRIEQHSLAEANKLQAVVAAATGTDHIDRAACEARGIRVGNVVGYATESVAQYTLSAVLNLRMQLATRDNFCKSGAYTRSARWSSPVPVWKELSGERWGIVGLGSIGSRVAELAHCFGCEPVFFSSSGRRGDARYPQLGLEELLKTSDIVSVHAPGEPRYHKLLDEGMLKLMQPTATLIVAGRGAIVDEAVTAYMLDAGLLAGAAFDVFEEEPFGFEHPFLSLSHPERLLLTPHMAWTSTQALANLVQGLVEQLQR